MRQFYAQLIRPGDVCFDVGAHVGNRVAAWTQMGARVVAVEPQPTFAALLRLLYGRHPGVSIVQAALGPRAGEQQMLVSSREPTVSTLSSDWATRMQHTKPSFARTQWDTTTRVRVTTLDALVQQYGVPAFCKIDVEGYDHEVLQGLSSPLPALSFEFIPPAWDLAAQCLDRLNRLGSYTFNWSSGESMRLELPTWVDSQQMAEVLRTIRAGALPGDVYARLR